MNQRKEPQGKYSGSGLVAIFDIRPPLLIILRGSPLFFNK